MFMVSINQDKCIGCGLCAESCPANILSVNDEKAFVSGDATECMGCETCISVCPSEAVEITEM